MTTPELQLSEHEVGGRTGSGAPELALQDFQLETVDSSESKDISEANCLSCS